MNKLIRITLITIFLVSFATQTVQASVLGWVTKSDDKNLITSPDSNWSFDTLYANIKQIDIKNSDSDIQMISVSETSNPITHKKTKKINRAYLVTATAYSSTPDQTDNSPFITASGTYVRDGVIATNFLPLSTSVKIPELYGDKIFIVEDRMNRRYIDRIDVWFAERQTAKNFGIKKVIIEVVS